MKWYNIFYLYFNMKRFFFIIRMIIILSYINCLSLLLNICNYNKIVRYNWYIACLLKCFLGINFFIESRQTFVTNVVYNYHILFSLFLNLFRQFTICSDQISDFSNINCSRNNSPQYRINQISFGSQSVILTVEDNSAEWNALVESFERVKRSIFYPTCV